MEGQPAGDWSALSPGTEGAERRRDKTRQLFAEALLLAREDAPGGDVGAAAAEAESAMYRQNGGVNARYKAKYRSLIFNLKDANNPDLRRRVLSGEITGVPPLENSTAPTLVDCHSQGLIGGAIKTSTFGS